VLRIPSTATNPVTSPREDSRATGLVPWALLPEIPAPGRFLNRANRHDTKKRSDNTRRRSRHMPLSLPPHTSINNP
jgi:hypothetical protein